MAGAAVTDGDLAARRNKVCKSSLRNFELPIVLIAARGLKPLQLYLDDDTVKRLRRALYRRALREVSLHGDLESLIRYFESFESVDRFARKTERIEPSFVLKGIEGLAEKKENGRANPRTLLEVID